MAVWGLAHSDAVVALEGVLQVRNHFLEDEPLRIVRDQVRP
jgi:hypothetical protein